MRMAEALGIVRGVITIVQISDSILSACYQYYNTAKDAESEIRNVVNTVSSLKCILEQLQQLLDSQQNADRIPHSTFLKEPIGQCENELTKLGTKIGITFDTTAPKRKAVVSFTRKLKWPWTKRGVDPILQLLETYKSTFITALSSDTLRTSLAIEDQIRDISLSHQKTNDEQRRDKILQWFKLSDPSTNHHSACEKHEPNTGGWFLESKQFKNWTNNSNATLWLYGIPGAGKTVLCSTAIEHVVALCRDSGHRYAYFYFDFNDPDKQTVEGMLRWVVKRLCHYHPTQLPASVEELYKQCDDGSHQPGTESLMKALLSLLAEPNRAFLILDALDECSERIKLLDIITRLVNANLLLVSRPEIDIKDGLAECVDISIISMQGDGNDKDIEIYVKKNIESLKRWQSKLEIRQEIQDVLVKKAKGM
jgi:Fungal N-terminal domain of STAND proteins/NACHT domain